MSWGERSCKWLYDENKPCKEDISMALCNVDCPMYESNGREIEPVCLTVYGFFAWRQNEDT
jgi:hypothetical protein